MPGYELSRFVELSSSDSEEYICSICRDILRNPVVTNCCLQTFCEQCINEWLETNNTCPYDRKELNRNQLSASPRVLTNILGKLKIRCIYETNGCKDVIFLENVYSHEKSCQFNKKICVKCLCDQLHDHDCIQSLLDFKHKLLQNNTELLQKNNELEDKLNLALNKISNLESENKTYFLLIHELSNANEPKPSTSNENIQTVCQISDKEILTEAKKYLRSPIIESNETSKEITDKILLIATSSIVESVTIYNLCDKIKDLVDSEFIGRWDCNAFYNNIGNYNSFQNKDYSVNINFGKLSINIYRICDIVDVPKLGQLLRSLKLKEGFKINEFDMNEVMRQTVKGIILNSLKSCDTLRDVSRYIKNSVAQQFGCTWHCMVYKDNFGNFCITHKDGKYALFTFSDLNFVIFGTT